jgi:hypothetical protein
VSWASQSAAAAPIAPFPTSQSSLLRRYGYPHQVPNPISAQEVATHRPLADVSSSFSQTLETEKRQIVPQNHRRYASTIMGTAQNPSANLGKPFIAEICGASAATATHRNYPNAHASPNTPTPAEVPSIAAQHPSHASPPLNRPPPARPGRRTDRYRRDSPVAQPSPNPNPNSAAEVGGADPDRHHTLILVCPRRLTRRQRPTTQPATPRASHDSHPINFGEKML